MPSPFCRPLSVDLHETRLLHVASELQDGMVSCSLEIVSLNEPYQAYNAISWTWGDTSQRSRIILNENVTDVVANAEEVLRSLVVRQGKASLPVWLDAICIDGTNIVKREQQIGIMRKIYDRAEKTLIWLRMDDGNATRALKSIRTLVEHYRKCTSDAEGDGSGVLKRPNIRNAGRWFSYGELPHACDWIAIQHLYSSQIFTRLWIVQEIALARKPLWSDVGLAADWMLHRNYERYTGMSVRGVTNAIIISEARRSGRERPDALLASSIHLDVSEPRDKIFGLLGLISWHNQRSPGSRREVHFDYSVSVASIYTKATGTVIASHHRLDVLSLPELNVDIAEVIGLVRDCPSWVPQFNARSTIVSKGIRNFSQNCCDNGKTLALDSSSPLEVLRVQGIRVANVANVIGILTTALLDDLQSLAELVWDIWASIKAQSADISALDRLFRVMTARNNDLLQDSDPDHWRTLRSSFNALWQECLKCWQDEDARWIEEANTSFPPCTKSYLDYVEHLRIVASHKTFFLTNDGQVGLGPSNTKAGDQVSIIFRIRNSFPVEDQNKGLESGRSYLLRPYYGCVLKLGWEYWKSADASVPGRIYSGPEPTRFA